MSREEIDDAIQQFSDRDQGGKMLLAALASRRPQGGTMGEVFMDALAQRPESIPPQSLPTLCLAMADVLDEAERSEPKGHLGRRQTWAAASRLLDATFRQTGFDRQAVLEQMFREGAAFGWLASVARMQRAKHKRNMSDVLLAQDNMELVNTIFRERCEAGTPTPIMSADALTVLWAWADLGGLDGAAAWCASQIETDEGLVGLLEQLRGWMASGDVVYYPLDRPSIGPFVDFDEARKRIATLKDSGGTLSERAAELFRAFQSGSDEFFRGGESFASEGPDPGQDSATS